MTQPVVISTPIINTPFDEPKRHYLFDEDGITNTIIESRRVSEYFVPIPRAKKKSGQLSFETEMTADRREENRMVNQIRGKVSLWRQGGYAGVTPTTARLLEYWTDPERSRRLFFCQIEALETAIYVTECARKYGDAWIENALREANDSSNPGLPRIALKMATGSGKTVVMAMLIAWQTLNKLANQQDARFTDSFLVITPGITIRDRLRVLKPNDPENYYEQLDLVPNWEFERLQQAQIVITNYHAFMPREKVSVSKLNKTILTGGSGESPFTETPGEVVRRVCRELGNRKNIIVLNDEAHHCYRRRPELEEEKLTKEEKDEIKQRDEEARVWISGVEAVKAKIGIRSIFDLSATPFFLRGSGYPEGTLFPWVVSDFSLVDAIESGIVKVPRVPVADDSLAGDQPTYREFWPFIRDELPKKGRKKESVTGDPQLPGQLHGALHSLYNDYERSFKRWQALGAEAHENGALPPVFIVVCNNTNVSKLVFDYISGWEKPADNDPDQTWVQAGKLELFRNDDGERGWRHRPNTILVDSLQLESGGAMSGEFKQAAAREIEEFKDEYRRRYPGRDVDSITDEELLREVLNTVGKRGKLGEHIRCVVSVSMLTEGWDANTVTHILGVRAFGTQLLCEQVVGRALRRMSYTVNDEGMFDPEYAEVYGVPFSFIPTNGHTGDPMPAKKLTRVKALEERLACEITFPRLMGYRYELPDGPLRAEFNNDSRMAIDTSIQPSWTEVRGVGLAAERRGTYDASTRANAVAFQLAVDVLPYLRGDRDPDTEKADTDNYRPWLFPQLLKITKEWMQECVTFMDNVTVAYLLADNYRQQAAGKIYKAIVTGDPEEERLKPAMRPYDPVGSTRYVGFDTSKPVFPTDAGKCHVSHVVGDTETWEQKMAQTLEEMPEVRRYVKNEGLDFVIPYVFEGAQRNYLPDFIACIDDGHGPDDLLNLIVEVSGENRKDKQEKVATARGLWVPAVNEAKRFGRWAFINITQPYNAANDIRAMLAENAKHPV